MAETGPHAEQRRRRRLPRLILLLALLAGLRVGLNCLSFPFFGHIDEIQHIDVMLKYSAGIPPTVAGDGYLPRSMWLNHYYGSPEYLPPGVGWFPPFDWPKPQRDQLLEQYLQKRKLPPELDHNYEAMQPPVYYVAAGAWMGLGRLLGWSSDLGALYVARCFGALLAAATVVLCFLLLRAAAPRAPPLLLYGAPALLAAFPQDCLYFVTNDAAGGPVAALSLLLAIGLRLRDAAGETVSMLHGLAVGLAAAATLMTKVSNVPVCFAVGLVLLLRMVDLRRAGRGIFDAGNRGLLIGAGAPVLCWMVYAMAVSGELFGTGHKTHICGFLPQTWENLKAHPMWSVSGPLTWAYGLCGRFWRGEAHWAGVEMGYAAMDAALLATTVAFVLTSLVASLRRDPDALPPVLAWPCFVVLGAGLAMIFVATLSWDYSKSANPSKDYPYVTSGRLLTALLAPFVIVYVHGLWRLTRCLGAWVPVALLGVLIAALLGTELGLMWPVLDSRFNFWHLSLWPG